MPWNNWIAIVTKSNLSFWPKDTVLNDVICDYNNLEGVMMDVFVESLPDRNTQPGFYCCLAWIQTNITSAIVQNIRDANSKN